MAPQNSLPGSVDIINQKTGNVVAQYAQNSDRVVNLTETSIVRINASPESVNFYERQGNDLIVHMKDGTTVRYQSFFELNEDGLHSQLVFDDNLGTHHAVFPYAAEAGPATAEAIVPTYADVGMDSLVGASGISALAVLGGIAAVGGIIGIAAASGGGGGGGGDDNNGIPGGGSNPDNPGGGTSPGGGDNGGGTSPGGGDNGGGTSPGGGDNGGGTSPGG
ncbi:BapA prefix-like domain-containing protein, partial [Phytobacter massiliensis]|uniref:BapA prefix-like domain-containing protein n=1 Tax=Phytobacter massiliensis TaxID=1485952 RepID=UPI000F0A7772